MKVTLISPYYDVTSIGMRILSSCLKKAGHDTKMIFLPQAHTRNQEDFLVYENDEMIKDLLEICAGSDLIGLTLMTNYYFRGIHLTRQLKKKINIPIIWGGVHPTVRPEECLETADLVCISESEHTIVELCNRIEEGKDFSDVPGTAFTRDGKVVRNDPKNFVQDLDLLPLPDYSIDDSFIIAENHVVPMDRDLLKQALLKGMKIERDIPSYQVMTSRGCPLDCAYCCNDIFRRLNTGKYLRHRSAENIITELKEALSTMDFIGAVWISDDTFFSRSTESIRRFAELYKREINLPFFCLGDPLHITEEKLDILCSSGMQLMTMGIQTGSERTKRLYKRSIANNKIISATEIIHRFNDRMSPPMYDIIVDNPYENRADEYETIQLISRIPRPFYLQLFSLTFFPGSSLYELAKKDGLITDEHKQIYNKPFFNKRATFYTLLLRIYNRKVPSLILKILSTRFIYRFFSMRVFDPLYRSGYRMRNMIKTKKDGR